MAAQGLSVFPVTPSSSSAANQSRRKPSEQFLSFNLSNSFVGRRLSIQPSSFSLIAPKRRSSTVATITFSLPTIKTQGTASDKKIQWSARAIKAFSMAEFEAHKLRYPNTGTEALLLGILVEGTSLAAKFLRDNGITFYKVLEETLKLLGKSNILVGGMGNPPLTKPAQRVLNWAVEEKLKSGEEGEITTAYILLGIWSEKEYAGHKILDTLGFDDEKAEELAKNKDMDIILTIKEPRLKLGSENLSS